MSDKTFTPTGDEMAGEQPGQVMHSHVPDELAGGVSPALAAEFASHLDSFHAAVVAWKQAQQDVRTQIALLNSWVGVLQTFTEKILPLIGNLLTHLQTQPNAAPALASAAAPGAIESQLRGMLDKFNGATGIIKEIVGLIPQQA